MNFKILESKRVGKIDANKCEDKIVTTDDYISIIDGATSKSDLTFNDKSIGRKASEILEDAIIEMPRNFDCSECVNYLSNKIYQFYETKSLIERMKKNPRDRLTASIAIYSNSKKEVWLIGDCQCIVGDEAYTNDKLIDKILSEVRAFYIESELLGDKSIDDLKQEDSGRNYILPLLKKQTKFQNNNFQSEYSYSVIDGFEPNFEDVKVVSVNSNPIVLASDGYPKLLDTLEKSEEYLKYILKNDPLCYKIFKSTKGLTHHQNSFDDRAYVKFKIPI